jgi:hypothetical protein
MQGLDIQGGAGGHAKGLRFAAFKQTRCGPAGAMYVQL